MEVNDIIIEEVRNQPFLYDLNHASYKDAKKKSMVWAEIGRKVNMNDNDCKKRWKSLRDCYYRCKRNEQLASGSAGGRPKKKWRYEDQMSFLESRVISRPTINNFISESNDTIIIDDNGTQEEIIPNEFEILEASCSSFAEGTPTPRKRLRKENDIGGKFDDFLGVAKDRLAQSCQAPDATTQHFIALAGKIKEAGLSYQDVNEIEQKVSLVVFEELSNRRKQD